MKRLFIVPAISLAVLLSGCSFIFSKLSDIEYKVSMEDKGEKMDRSDWLSDLTTDFDKSNFNTSESVKSFTLELWVKSDSKESTKGGDKYDTTETTRQKTSYKFNTDTHRIAGHNASQKKTVVEDDYGKTTTNTTTSEDTAMQVDGSNFLSINNTERTYTQTSCLNNEDAIYRINSNAKSILSAGYAPFQLAVLTANEDNSTFYKNKQIYTIVMENTSTEEVPGYSANVGYREVHTETTVQVNLTSGKYACYYTYKQTAGISYYADDEYYGYVKGSTKTSEDTGSWKAEYKFETPNINLSDISTYTKLAD